MHCRRCHALYVAAQALLAAVQPVRSAHASYGVRAAACGMEIDPDAPLHPCVTVGEAAEIEDAARVLEQEQRKEAE